VKISKLISVLKSCLIEKLIKDENGTYETLLLTPSSREIEEYKKGGHGLTRMDHAAYALGMSKTAFDLMLAKHTNIFRRIARYEGRWYLSNLYIKALKEEEGFPIVKAKYEVPHTNLWVNTGMGSLPRPWYMASAKVSEQRYPYAL